MNFVLIAVSCCLLAQAQDPPDRFEPGRRARSGAPAATLDEEGLPPADEPLREQPVEERPLSEEAPADNRSDLQTIEARPRQKLRPPELIAEALENPKEGALNGSPLTLAQAIARTNDRQQQLLIAQAYWRLATAQAEYHWMIAQRDALRAHTQTHTNTPGTLSARAAARADMRDAQLQVEQAQQDLVQLLGVADTKSLPLASDRPHVGEYRTYYETIFKDRAPPARIRLIHRTLPVRRKAIDAHAEAILAALDAVAGAGEEFHSSGQGLTTLLESLALLKQERRAFIETVRTYNLDIAEYAINVAPANVQGQNLVSMLIRTSPPARGAAPPVDGGANPTQRKTFRQGAVEQGTVEQSTVDQGTLRAAVPNAGAEEWTVAYQPSDVPDDPGMYQGLLGVKEPPKRVQKLGNLLHWDRNMPPDAGRPLSLPAALQNVPPAERLAVIGAYWQAREAAARYQALMEQQEQLSTLQAVAISLHKQPGMAEAGVRLQAARRAAKAAVYEAQLALSEAQFELMQKTGQRLDDSWVLPSTPPQAGRYLVSIGARRGFSKGAHWADVMGLQFDKLEHRADAVLQADAHRVELVSEARQHQASDPADAGSMTILDRAIWSIGRQNRQTLDFLQDLTGYNMAIAHYALSTLGESLSGEQLASKLAIARSTLRDS